MKRAVLRVGSKPVAHGKQRVNMFLDVFVVEYFKAKAGVGGASLSENRDYQTLINKALVDYIHNHNLKEDLRQIFREELEQFCSAEASPTQNQREIPTLQPEQCTRKRPRSGQGWPGAQAS